MSVYFFTMTKCHYRTGLPMGKMVGVILADSQDEAERKVWEEYGSDSSCELDVWEVINGKESFTVFYNR